MLNFNVGVLGHVDSGKTSLAKSLSTTASTACFDKNPQSKERGITIDLGFSSFVITSPMWLQEAGYDKIQYTLVDCPGHASLIRTIIGGAQIIDAMMLVVDVTKGMQTQTAECLVIGEILCNKLLVVLNKVDLVPAEKRNSVVEKMTKRLLLTLQNTKFAGSEVVVVAAKPGGPEAPEIEPVGIKELIDALVAQTHVPKRETGGEFIFAVDHCFSIRGQGTIMTGTVLQGSVAVNDSIEIPYLKVIKKVKSMQMFRQPVEKAVQGDRLGICVTQFDPKQLERGIVGTPGVINLAFGVIAEVRKIAYYKLEIESKSKFHISLGHETVMARVTFFSTNEKQDQSKFNYDQEYIDQEKLLDLKKQLENVDSDYVPLHQYALIEFEKPIPVLPKSIVIASRLDMDVHTSMCRLAFRGQPVVVFTEKNYIENQLSCVKVYKNKSKEGTVERLANDNEVIVKNLLKKDTNIQLFVGLKVKLSTGEEGMIDGTFGQSGKIKVRIMNELQNSTKVCLLRLSGGKKKGKGNQENMEPSTELSEPVKVTLHFKKYIYKRDKKMVQT